MLDLKFIELCSSRLAAGWIHKVIIRRGKFLPSEFPSLREKGLDHIMWLGIVRLETLHFRI